MKLRILYLMFLWVTAVYTKSYYFISTPWQYQAGQVATTTLSVKALLSNATVTVSLKTLDGKVLVTASKVISVKFVQVYSLMEKINIQVPYRFKGKAKLEIIGKGGITFVHFIDISVKQAKEQIFVQSDKPMYKPGGKVKFRVVIINPDLKPVQRKIAAEIFITNPSGSRLKQWSNSSLDCGMISLSMSLSSKPVLGKWKITVKYGESIIVKEFEVKKYVLPKFEVTIKPPKYLFRNMKNIPITICAKYTYGKAVIGSLTARICQNNQILWRKNRKLCTVFSKKIDGCVDVDVTSDRLISKESLKIHASVIETATGVTLNSTHNTGRFRNRDVKISFDVPKYFKPSFMFKVKILVTKLDGRPATNRFVEIKVRKKISKTNAWVNQGKVNIKNGVYTFNIYPKPEVIEYTFTAIQDNVHVTQSVYAYYSPSKTFLQIQSAENLVVNKYAKISVLFSHVLPGLYFNYLLVCRGKILLARNKIIYSPKLVVHFKVTHEMLPMCRMLGYYIRSDGEFVADNKQLVFNVVFKNKVSIILSDTKSKPGEKINITLKASPGSIFALSAVDRSVQLLGASSDLTEEQVSNLLRKQDIGTSSLILNKCVRHGCVSKWSRRCYYEIENRVDGKRSIKESGLVYFTNAKVDVIPCPKKKEAILDLHYREKARLSSARLSLAPLSSARQMIRIYMNMAIDKTFKFSKKRIDKDGVEKNVRTEFPETWLWTEETLQSKSGEKTISVKVPDTITTWYASGFALSPNDGIGVASPVGLQAFQPFFVSALLPYSVIRGEGVKIPATVFNYLDDCLVVDVHLKASSNYDIVSTATKKMCICGSKSSTFKFKIMPKTLGRIDITIHAMSSNSDSSLCGTTRKMADQLFASDAITKKLLVEAEGIKKEFSTSSFFCPKDHSGSYSNTFRLDINEAIVPGSVYAELSVVGDLMGPSMEGIDKLLAMPHGCGEQNMLKFAPNIYIMDYLTATNQRNAKISDKAKEYMESGYQRELTYKHKSGAYSAFGERDEEGSTWLTAFVLRTYVQAQRYIFIDKKDINDSKNWLLSLQQSSGCFKEVGMVLHKEMKGGVTSGITMTAFVMNALLEAELPHNDPRIKKALHCIHKGLDSVTKTYTAAVLAYSLSLAGSPSKSLMLTKLRNSEIKGDGLIHWESSKKSTKKLHLFQRAKSSDIEMTAYALMSYIGGRTAFGSPLENLKIVKWIVKQRNPHGGFSSTQDTCVGLQALAQYAAASFSGSYNLKISATANDFDHTFEVRDDNKLLLQRAQIPNIPTDVKLEATGEGCALVQANVKYNLQNVKEPRSFYLNVKVTDHNLLSCKHTMRICTSFTGSGISNMALIDVTMVSGFKPVISELDQAMQTISTLFSYYEFENGVLSLYFNDFDQTSKCVSFTMEQFAEVDNRKPATVKVYDYYDTDKSASTKYSVGKCREMNPA